LREAYITIDEIQNKLESDNVLSVIATAVEEMFWGASEKKIQRFAMVVANTIEFATTEQQFEDAVAFIRALDELSEDDIKVLNHLYNHQRENFPDCRNVEPDDLFSSNSLIHLITEAGKTGMRAEEFYSRCGRLHGYGLTLPLERPPGTDDSIVVYRITGMGIELVEILRNLPSDQRFQ